MTALAIAIYVLLLLLMLAYGANSFVLVAVHARRRRRVGPAAPTSPIEHCPRVTVQLPIYNEANVVGRLLEAAGAIDWPRDRLEIQLLDDSTDHTREIAAEHVARLHADGVRITHVRRPRRTGYKAGALAFGMGESDGEFFAIFDADFVPPPDFLRRGMGYFRDPQIAAVQGRWTHLNPDYSGLTRAQVLAIDGHFGVEQSARMWSGWLLNFNGTAGIWRRDAIEDAGGWSAETLTEDLDLSYRAQLRGWRIAFDPTLECPSELPTQLAAFKAQQRRWATGSMQTARRQLPRVWRSPLSLATKIQATLHLTHYAVHPLIAVTALLSIPCVLWPGLSTSPGNLWLLPAPFALAMSGPTLLYSYAQRALSTGRRWQWRDLGVLTLLGIGITVSNTRAVAAAFRRSSGAFIRTPKLGIARRGERPAEAYRARSDGLLPFETLLAAYCLVAGVALVWAEVYVVAPFMFLDAAGLAWVAAIGRAEARAYL